MIPSKLTEFIDSLNDRKAAKKLSDKLNSLQRNYGDNFQYTTKIAYYVDEETNVARLIFTSLVGKQSYDVFNGNIAEFISKAHKLEDGRNVEVFGIVLTDFLTMPELEALNNYNRYCEKKISKDSAKQAITVRYKLGDVLTLKSKIRDGSKKIIKKFIVKKIIWSICSNPVNVIVVKQVEGPVNNMSLTKADCKKYHIKYEENLQVYSMLTNFIKLKQ